MAEGKYLIVKTAKDPLKDYLWFCPSCYTIGSFESLKWMAEESGRGDGILYRRHECDGGRIKPLIPQNKKEEKWAWCDAPSALYKKDFDRLSPEEQQQNLQKVRDEIEAHKKWFHDHLDEFIAEDLQKEAAEKARKAAEANKPRCPHCQSQSIKKISMLNRSLSVGLFGLASDKIGKQFQCESCGYKW